MKALFYKHSLGKGALATKKLSLENLNDKELSHKICWEEVL
jgi:hypothetical protein